MLDQEAGSEAAAALGMAVGDQVIYVERLLCFNGETVVFDQIHLVSDLFAGLTLESLSAGDRSLYSLFENDYGVRMIHAEEHLRAVAADPYSAGLLGVQSGRRCCWSNAPPTPTATRRSSGGAASIAPTGTITAMILADTDCRRRQWRKLP